MHLDGIEEVKNILVNPRIPIPAGAVEVDLTIMKKALYLSDKAKGFSSIAIFLFFYTTASTAVSITSCGIVVGH